MELSFYEAANLKAILESLVSTCEVMKGDGAYVVDRQVWLTPGDCYMISSLIDKLYSFCYGDTEVSKTLLSKAIYQGASDVE